MGYVIHLHTDTSRTESNYYGYWSGKSYTFQGGEYPVFDDTICERTKVYKNRKRAENAAQKCMQRFGYVRNACVEEVGNA